MTRASFYWLTLCGLLLLLTACQRTAPPATPAAANLALPDLSGEVFGTSYHIRFGPPPTDLGDVNAAVLRLTGDLARLFSEIDREMSTWREDSVITAFNRSAEAAVTPISPRFAAIVEMALAVSELTGGAYDPTIGPVWELWGFRDLTRRVNAWYAERLLADPLPSPETRAAWRIEEHRLRTLPVTALPSDAALEQARAAVGYTHLHLVEGGLSKSLPGLQLDLSSIAKGAAVDLAAELLAQQGLGNFYVEIGGEVVARGRNLRGLPWRLGIQSPLPGSDSQHIAQVVALDNRAMATSGDYESYFVVADRTYPHILDGRTGQPAADLASATVIATTCAYADAIATAVCALGPRSGLALLEALPEVEGLVITRESPSPGAEPVLHYLPSSGWAALEAE